MSESDAAYFGRRAQEERAAAEKAGSAEARRVHLEMAERYDDLARTIGGSDNVRILHTRPKVSAA